MNYLELRKKSERLRLRLIELIHSGKTGHTGGDLSVLNLLTVLYNRIQNATGTPLTVKTLSAVQGATEIFGRASFSGTTAKEKGFCWSEEPYPTIFDNRSTTVYDNNGDMPFENMTQWGSNGSKREQYFRHNDIGNVCWLDGHVSGIKNYLNHPRQWWDFSKQNQ